MAEDETRQTHRRTALILRKDLSVGQVGNVGAILMGDVVRGAPEIMAFETVLDSDGLRHAAARYNVVILAANSSEQLRNGAGSLSSSYRVGIHCRRATTEQSIRNLSQRDCNPVQRVGRAGGNCGFQ